MTTKPFFGLLADAIDLVPDGSVADERTRYRLAKVSAFTSAFALESAANCLLDLNGYSTPVAEAIERMSTIDKFELLGILRHPSARMDRGRDEVGLAVSLMQVRNNLVHPKLSASSGIVHLSDPSSDLLEFTHHSVNAKKRRFPSPDAVWDVEHARDAVRTVCGFVSYFLTDVCAMTPNASQRALATRIDTQGQSGFHVETAELASFRLARDGWGARVTFAALEHEA